MKTLVKFEHWRGELHVDDDAIGMVSCEEGSPSGSDGGRSQVNLRSIPARATCVTAALPRATLLVVQTVSRRGTTLQ